MLQETEASSLIYTTGCIESLTNWINDNLHIVGGLAFGFAVIQVRWGSFVFHDRGKLEIERGRRGENNLSQNSVQTPMSVYPCCHFRLSPKRVFVTRPFQSRTF